MKTLFYHLATLIEDEQRLQEIQDKVFDALKKHISITSNTGYRTYWLSPYDDSTILIGRNTEYVSKRIIVDYAPVMWTGEYDGVKLGLIFRVWIGGVCYKGVPKTEEIKEDIQKGKFKDIASLYSAKTLHEIISRRVENVKAIVEGIYKSL